MNVKYYSFVIYTVIRERKIFSCTEMGPKMIQNTKKEYFHICLKNKLKYLAIMIVLLVFKKPKKELEESWDGKSWAS